MIVYNSEGYVKCLVSTGFKRGIWTVTERLLVQILLWPLNAGEIHWKLTWNGLMSHPLGTTEN